MVDFEAVLTRGASEKESESSFSARRAFLYYIEKCISPDFHSSMMSRFDNRDNKNKPSPPPSPAFISFHFADGLLILLNMQE